MISFLKLIPYALFLYLVRLFAIGWIEQYTIFGPMHEPMATYEDCFGFTMDDLPLSHLFNYCLWLSVVLLFHLIRKSLEVKTIWASLIVFGICGLFFISLTGAYMNHFNDGIRVFFRYAMLDGVLLFGLLGLLNGWIYPLIFKEK